MVKSAKNKNKNKNKNTHTKIQKQKKAIDREIVDNFCSLS